MLCGVVCCDNGKVLINVTDKTHVKPLSEIYMIQVYSYLFHLKQYVITMLHLRSAFDAVDDSVCNHNIKLVITTLLSQFFVIFVSICSM